MKTLNEVISNPGGLDSSHNYLGQENFPGLYVLLSQTRDSGTLERSNFISALQLLGGEKTIKIAADDGDSKCTDFFDEIDEVITHRFGHWACGWFELLCVHKDSPQFKIASEIKERLKDYPVVDEEHLNQLEWDEAQEYWQHTSMTDRLALCHKFNISCFAIRRDQLPLTDSGELCAWEE